MLKQGINFRCKVLLIRFLFFSHQLHTELRLHTRAWSWQINTIKSPQAKTSSKSMCVLAYKQTLCARRWWCWQWKFQIAVARALYIYAIINGVPLASPFFFWSPQRAAGERINPQGSCYTIPCNKPAHSHSRTVNNRLERGFCQINF